MTPEEIAEMQKQNEAFKTQLADAGKGADQVLRTENENLAKLNKELIQGRDEAKEKKRIAEESALKQNGEFEVLSVKLQGEKDELLKQNEANETVLGTYKARDEARLATLMETVPVDLKDTITDDLPLATRLALAEKLAAVKPGGPNPRPGGDPHEETKTRAEFDALPTHEKSAYAIKGGQVTD